MSYSDKRSSDFLANLEKLKDRKIWPNFIQKESALPAIIPDGIVIDAIFGIGLNREPDDWVRELMTHINQSKAYVVSIDVPSGLYLDKPLDNSKAVIRAHYVLSIQAPKLAFFLPETGIFCEQWSVLDIGMDREYLLKTEVEYHLVGKEEVLQWYRPRNRFTHKGHYGHSLIIGGSYGKIGAVILSAKSCLATGSGLVTALVPHCGYIPLQSAAEEVMVITVDNQDAIQHLDYEITPSVVGIGMGMGTEKGTATAFASFLKKYENPLVIDADGLNILAEEKSLLKLLPVNSVLTPHPGELQRLLGSWKDDFEKLKKAKAFAEKYKCILVLKDAYTIVVNGKIGYVNSTGNPGMATAGSGDVLTGMITGMIAVGYEPLKASVMAVYLHGLAGNLAAKKMGYEALTAGKIIENIGEAFLELLRLPETEDSGQNQSENG